MSEDFDPPSGFGVTFSAAGLSGDTMQCATITTTDDDILEGDHAFTVMIDSVTPDVVTAGMPSSQTATLLDNESKLRIVLCKRHHSIGEKYSHHLYTILV